MKNTTNVISAKDEELLRSIKGARIVEISIARSALAWRMINEDEQEPVLDASSLDHLCSQMVVLHLENEVISFWTTEIANRKDEYPDLAHVDVIKDSQDRFNSLQCHYVSWHCDRIVQKVEIINEKVKIMEPNALPFILSNTKAIIVHFSNGKIVMEKECVWSETWQITFLNENAEYAFYDQWRESADDDKASYQVTLERYLI